MTIAPAAWASSPTDVIGVPLQRERVEARGAYSPIRYGASRADRRAARSRSVAGAGALRAGPAELDVGRLAACHQGRARQLWAVHSGGSAFAGGLSAFYRRPAQRAAVCPLARRAENGWPGRVEGL